MTTEVTIPSLNGPDVPATLEGGGSDDHVVVLSHGIFVTRSENGRFDRVAPLLAEAGMSSLRYDLAGHGASEVQSADATVARMAGELSDVCTWAASNFDRVSLVASSFSGALAALSYEKLGSTLEAGRLIFLNPVLDFINVFVEPELPEMAEVFSRSGLTQAYQTGFFNPQPTFRMSRAMVFELEHLDVVASYAAIAKDHLMLHGTADELVSYSHAKGIAERNDACEFVSIAGGVHAFTQSGHEPAVWDLVLEYLRRS